ncbi:MAG: transposase [Thermoanaerobaculia bacterium]
MVGRTAPAFDVHLIADNYATHKHPKALRWLERHPRFHVHLTPTSASWLNIIERFFRDLSTKRIRRGSFSSVAEYARQSTTTSTRTTAILAPSYGPRRRTRSSKRSGGLALR